MPIHALRGITCRIEKGTFNFILGPSGSGKSTLLYLVGALDNVTDGQITVAGRRIDQFTAKQRDDYRRNEVGFIFQSFNLLTNLDAVDNVLIPYMPQGVSSELRQRAIALMEQVGLGDRIDHRPNQLSGGEQQRVAIARALLKKPSIVLADEPTGELDSQTGAEVLNYLRKLRDENDTTVVIVTHDKSLISKEDRVLLLRDGRLETD
jgi:putative ABC transport system ATP-binding protein